MNSKDKKILIIVPAFNEGKNLSDLFGKLKDRKINYDVVVINDCSCDNTSKVCREHDITVIDLPVNLGIGGAVQTGYKYAFYNDYDIAIQVDGDGQHNPIYIQMLIEKLKQGCNMVIGSRFIEKNGFQSSYMRRVGIRFFSKLIKLLTGHNATDPTSGFRACDRKVIEYFNNEYPVDYPEPETIVALKRNGFRISEIPVLMDERREGESSITFFKSIYYMVKVTLAILIVSIEKSK